MQAKLVYHVKVIQSRDFQFTSDVAWINKDKMLITIDSELYMINLRPNNLKETPNGVRYTYQ